MSTWRPSEILAYGPGVVAGKALTNLFEQVATKLQESETGSDYDTKLIMKGTGDGRPCLEVGLKSWARIFGADSVLRRVLVLYNVGDVSPDSEGTIDAISFEIALWWPSSFRGDWERVRRKIKDWLKALKKAGFELAAYSRGWKPVERDLLSYSFEDEPVYISAYPPTNKGINVSLRELKTKDSEELVEQVHELVLKHCQAVTRLT